MVLGLRTKNRKGTSVQVDYLIHVEEIKPWPPSQALKSLRSVMLQWENGDRNSGTINPVIPSLGSGVGDGKVEFNESFRIGVTLSKEVSVKGGDAEVYQKNCIQFNLYEPRRDKTVKGQHLGTVIVDLAEYGIVKEPLIVSAPLNCKRSFRNAVQSLLFIKIQPYDKNSSSTLLKETLSKEASLDKEGKESVSALMNVEYADEAEVASSFTDDDGSSHSSATVSSSVFEATGSSPPQNDEDALEAVNNDKVESTGDPDLRPELIPEKSEVKPVIAEHKHLNGGSSRSSSTDLSSAVESQETDHASLSNIHDRTLTSESRNHSAQSSSPSIAHEGTAGEAVCNNNVRNFVPNESFHEVHGKIFYGESTNKGNTRHSQEENNTKNLAEELASSDANLLLSEKVRCSISTDSEVNGEENWKGSEQNKSGSEEAADSLPAGLAEDKDDAKWRENGQIDLADEQKGPSSEYESFSIGSQDVNRKPASMDDAPQFSKRGFRVKGYSSSNDRLRHVKSVRSLLDSSRSCSSLSDNHLIGDAKETETLEETCCATSLSDRKVQEFKSRIEKLEGELREAAAVEVALYSIVAEHGSSVNKVHAPARRLSRLYLHGSKQGSRVSRASAARSAISGLVLVAKACGNDVPRLTFWMSNSIVLRAIISRALADSKLPISAGPRNETNGSAKENGQKSSSLAWKKTSPEKNKNMLSFVDNLDDWEDPLTLIVALEKIEAWIFSRVIESIWWQTLTPHMQPTSRRGNEQRMSSIVRKNYGRKSSLCGEEQANFSLELWKNAFNDACERLCPVRASGHECGCLPVLARLVMEQCVHRLDVAMFNALLRESADEIPTDPVSDPISDSSVLPIPAGTSSFGSGAQLKNAIGNWSRWLTDLFGLDDDILHQGENEDDAYDREESEATSKSFHLLNALSDLMMLPKDMLLERSIRKEVCPTFSAPLIKRILHNFVPDEFCPDPIPKAVFEVLDAEDPLEEEEIRNFPHNATPVVYSPPSAALLQSIIGEIGNETQLRRSGSSVLRKSYTSDDELDELDSPLSSIFIDSPRAPSTPNWPSKENGGRNVVRYQLLREVWRDED